MTMLLSIPIIMGIVEAIKLAGAPKQLLPIISIAIGLLFGTLVYLVSGEVNDVAYGIVFGLSASGLYDAGETLIK